VLETVPSLEVTRRRALTLSFRERQFVTRDENRDAVPLTPDMFDRRAVCVKLNALNVALWDGTTLCGAPSEEMR
jgi:hypothetical protein